MSCLITLYSDRFTGKIEQIGGVECYVATPTGDYPKDKVILFLTDVFGIPLPNNKVFPPSALAPAELHPISAAPRR